MDNQIEDKKKLDTHGDVRLIEIINAYPMMHMMMINGKKIIKKQTDVKKVNWSLHIKLEIRGFIIELRGLTLKPQKDGWFVMFHSKSNYDDKQDKTTWFPVVDFDRKEKNKLIAEILKTVDDIMPFKISSLKEELAKEAESPSKINSLQDFVPGKARSESMYTGKRMTSCATDGPKFSTKYVNKTR